MARFTLEQPRWPDDGPVAHGFHPDGLLGGIDWSGQEAAPGLAFLMGPAETGNGNRTKAGDEATQETLSRNGGFYNGIVPYQSHQDMTLGGIAVPPVLPSGISLIPTDQLHAIMPGTKYSDIETMRMPLAIAMADHGISLPSQQAAFLAQIAAEGGIVGKTEDLKHYTPENLMKVFNKKSRTLFPSLDSARRYAGNEQKTANYVYDGINGNIPDTDDGWRFRGRGPMQVTGRANYRAIGFEDDPDALNTPYGGAQGSAAWWENNGLPQRTASELDRQAFDRVSRRVNHKGLNADLRWYAYQRALGALK